VRLPVRLAVHQAPCPPKIKRRTVSLCNDGAQRYKAFSGQEAYKRNRSDSGAQHRGRRSSGGILRRIRPLRVRSSPGIKIRNDNVLLTLVERKSRNFFVIPLADKTADCIMKAMEQLWCTYSEHFSKVFKTITTDDGSEFADLSVMEAIS
jgi:IS30 family transposase